MRLLSFLAGLSGLFLAGALAAQTPVPANPPPPPPLEAENTWYLDLSTGGRVAIQLRPDVAPVHVERIKTLTRQHFYDGLVFHRVIEGFMAQGGDPTGTGESGSGLPDLNAEIHGLLHVRGAVGMARAQELNSANSQFFIMFVPRLTMDRDYTVFGRVVSGMNFVDAIERGEPPASPTRIVHASIASDNVPLLSAEALRAAPARPAQALTAPVLAAPALQAAAAPPPAAPTAEPAAPATTLPPPAAEPPAPTPESAPPTPTPAPVPPEPAPAPTTPPQPVVQDGTAPPQPPAQAAPTPPPPAPEQAAPPAAPDEEEDEAAPPPTEPAGTPPPQ